MSTSSSSKLAVEAERAQSLFRAGRATEALHAYQRVLELDGDHLEALNVIGMGSLSRGQTARAMQVLQHAARVHPADALTRHNLGLVFETLATGTLLRADSGLR